MAPSSTNIKELGSLRVVLTRGPLVSTETALNNEATPAIGLAYLAGYIAKHGIRSEIVDGIALGLNRVWPNKNHPGYICHGLTYDEIAAHVPDDVDVIAISNMFSGEWPVQRDLIKYLKGRFPAAYFIAGGEHITALNEYVLGECPEIDCCVLGEGERTLLSVLEAYVQGGSLAKIDGVAYNDDDGNYTINQGLPRIRDIDSIPWPKWPEGYLETFWQAGKSFGVQVGRDMPINVSRGCPYQCTFCSNPSMWTTRYILRDIEDVIDEIKTYIERYDIDSLQFYDLTAIAKRSWALEFARRLEEEDIRLKWSLPSGTRSEVLDKEVLSAIQAVGCDYLVFAPESGSARTLERIKKRIKLENLTKSVVTAHRLGIVTRANLIIGFPGETRIEVWTTILYGLKLAFLGIDEVPINIYSAYPGSELFRDLQGDRKINLSDNYFLGLTSINADFTKLNPMTMNDIMSARELALYRITAMLMNYIVGYLTRPSRIWRTLRNVFGSGSKAATVLEHRLKDSRRRKVAEAGIPSPSAGE
jgi:anaerobic magnesium-protoporphyrin IX monomethyl ester cyclase